MRSYFQLGRLHGGGGILKKKCGYEEPRDRTGVKTQNGLEDMGRGKGKLGQSERVAWTYIY